LEVDIIKRNEINLKVRFVSESLHALQTRPIVHLFNYLLNKCAPSGQIKIILFIQDKGAITNTQIQKLCNVSKRTASTYLSELESVYIEKSGTTGKGTTYFLKGH
jgi:ATP-dependent DNA helicase RecG